MRDATLISGRKGLPIYTLGDVHSFLVQVLSKPRRDIGPGGVRGPTHPPWFSTFRGRLAVLGMTHDLKRRCNTSGEAEVDECCSVLKPFVGSTAKAMSS